MQRLLPFYKKIIFLVFLLQSFMLNSMSYFDFALLCILIFLFLNLLAISEWKLSGKKENMINSHRKNNTFCLNPPPPPPLFFFFFPSFF